MSAKGGSKPSTPSYTPAAPYTSAGPYTNAPSYTQAPAYSSVGYVTPSDPNQTVPQADSAMQIAQQGAQVESTLPAWLQLNNNPFGTAQQQQYQDNYYQQNDAPALAQLKTQVYNNGQAYGSYGGGMVGAQAAQGQLDSYNAALNYASQLNQAKIASRQSLFSGGDTLAAGQNQLGVQRGLGVAQIQSANTANQNQFNLGQSENMNSYNLSNNQSSNAYGLSNNQGLNSFGLSSAANQNQYNLGTNQTQNNFKSSVFGTQGQMYGSQLQANSSAFGTLGGVLASPNAAKLATAIF